MLINTAAVQSQQQEDESRQEVFTVFANSVGVRYALLPEDTVVYLRIAGLTEDQHPAPLPEGSQMLCHFVHGEGSRLRCGNETFKWSLVLGLKTVKK
jgi:hypothetical protein